MTYRHQPFLRAAGCLLVLLSNPGCSDDDGQTPGDGGMDSGTQADGGRAGTSGGTTAGRGGSTGRAGSSATAGAGSDEDGGMNPPEVDAGDAGRSDASADGGAAGSSANAGTGGGGGSGGSSAPAAGCKGLDDCCKALTNPERMSCELVADNAEDAMCDQFKPFFCTPPDANEDACPMLNECCETLERGALRLACAMLVTDGMPLACEQGLLAFCPSGGDPNACQTLSTCCQSLPPPQRPGCNTIVGQGIASNCEIVEATLCP